MIILLIPLIFGAVCWLAGLSFAGWLGLAAVWEFLGFVTKPRPCRRKAAPSAEVPTPVGVLLIAVVVVLIAVVVVQQSPEPQSRAVTFPLASVNR